MSFWAFRLTVGMVSGCYFFCLGNICFVVHDNKFLKFFEIMCFVNLIKCFTPKAMLINWMTINIARLFFLFSCRKPLHAISHFSTCEFRKARVPGLVTTGLHPAEPGCNPGLEIRVP
jgi:hypothetical protein